LTLISPTSGGRSVGIVRLRTEAKEFFNISGQALGCSKRNMLVDFCKSGHRCGVIIRTFYDDEKNLMLAYDTETMLLESGLFFYFAVRLQGIMSLRSC
jgi:hypothetical protein